MLLKKKSLKRWFLEISSILLSGFVCSLTFQTASHANLTFLTCSFNILVLCMCCANPVVLFIYLASVTASHLEGCLRKDASRKRGNPESCKNILHFFPSVKCMGMMATLLPFSAGDVYSEGDHITIAFVRCRQCQAVIFAVLCTVFSGWSANNSTSIPSLREWNSAYSFFPLSALSSSCHVHNTQTFQIKQSPTQKTTLNLCACIF